MGATGIGPNEVDSPTMRTVRSFPWWHRTELSSHAVRCPWCLYAQTSDVSKYGGHGTVNKHAFVSADAWVSATDQRNVLSLAVKAESSGPRDAPGSYSGRPGPCSL